MFAGLDTASMQTGIVVSAIESAVLRIFSATGYAWTQVSESAEDADGQSAWDAFDWEKRICVIPASKTLEMTTTAPDNAIWWELIVNGTPVQGGLVHVHSSLMTGAGEPRVAYQQIVNIGYAEELILTAHPDYNSILDVATADPRELAALLNRETVTLKTVEDISDARRICGVSHQITWSASAPDRAPLFDGEFWLVTTTQSYWWHDGVAWVSVIS